MNLKFLAVYPRDIKLNDPVKESNNQISTKLSPNKCYCLPSYIFSPLNFVLLVSFLLFIISR